MRVYVTGWDGFVGPHLINRLEKEEGVEIVRCRCDIRNITDLHAEMKSDIDVVLHLAAMTKANESLENPHPYIDVNAMGTCNILECMRLAGIPKIVNISSGGVKDFFNGSPYLWSKIIAEKLVIMYSKLYGIKSIIIRPNNIYGPNNYKGVIYHWMKAKKAGETLHIHGDGNQTRDFVHVYDVVDAIVKAMRTNKIIPLSVTLEVGTGVGTKVIDLAKMMVGDNYVIHPELEHLAGIKKSVGNPVTTSIFLEWKAEITLKEGLKTL